MVKAGAGLTLKEESSSLLEFTAALAHTHHATYSQLQHTTASLLELYYMYLQSTSNLQGTAEIR